MRLLIGHVAPRMLAAATLFALAACADRQAPTGPSDIASTPALATPAVMTGDPTRIPFGSPSRIDFFGRASSSRRAIIFPLAAAEEVDHQEFLAKAYEKLEQLRAEQARGTPDPQIQHVIARGERLLAAKGPAELRALLGPNRTRIVSTYGVRAVGPRLIDHTASFSLDGQELIRVTTRASTVQPLLLEVPIDDGGGGSSGAGSCSDGTEEYVVTLPAEIVCGYDPYFDPAPSAADVAATQAQVDWMASQVAAAPPEPYGDACYPKFLKYVGAIAGYAFTSGKVIYWGWKLNWARVGRWLGPLTAAAWGIEVAGAELLNCRNGIDRLRL
jgi:hypothetical protein